MITPILLCGGSGTRLWPLSRKSFPKQFADLMGDESLFQASARRFTGEGFGAPLIVTGDDVPLYRDRAAGRGRHQAREHPDRTRRAQYRACGCSPRRWCWPSTRSRGDDAAGALRSRHSRSRRLLRRGAGRAVPRPRTGRIW